MCPLPRPTTLEEDQKRIPSDTRLPSFRKWRPEQSETLGISVFWAKEGSCELRIEQWWKGGGGVLPSFSEVVWGWEGGTELSGGVEEGNETDFVRSAPSWGSQESFRVTEAGPAGGVGLGVVRYAEAAVG